MSHKRSPVWFHISFEQQKKWEVRRSCNLINYILIQYCINNNNNKWVLNNEGHTLFYGPIFSKN